VDIFEFSIHIIAARIVFFCGWRRFRKGHLIDDHNVMRVMAWLRMRGGGGTSRERDRRRGGNIGAGCMRSITRFSDAILHAMCDTGTMSTI
jgi:hypothetical protein